MPYPTFFNLPEEKRQKILECAVDEFAQHEYDSASISRIVARARIAKGSLYQYFEDKSDLHRYLLGLAIKQKAEMMREVRALEPRTNFFETLRRLFREMANFEILYPRLAKIGYRALYGKSPLPGEIMAQARLSTVQYFEDLIEQGKQLGEIRPEVDSATAAYIFTAALGELSSYLATRAEIESTKTARESGVPVQAGEVNKILEQIVAVLRFGMENKESQER